MPLTSTLQEMILVEHFKSPLNLTMLDMAEWAQTFAEYPSAMQWPSTPPIELSAPNPVQFQIRLAQVDLPRLVLRSPDGNRSIQFQTDRFAMGWTRSLPLGQPTDYPGYDILKKEWIGALKKFHQWCGQRLGVVPGARLVEIGYNNAALITVAGRKRRLSEIFRWVQPGRPINAFQVTWAEFLSQEPNPARVAAQVGLGPVLPSEDALLFNFTGFGPVDAPGESPQALGMLDSLHSRILDMYAAAIISETETLQ
jgi:uncharacterized protein (TIGR04255 family)